jgi:hypothetical protein
MAFGGGGAFGLAIILRAGGFGLSFTGVSDRERDSRVSLVVAAESSPVSLPSSSSPNESLLLASVFFFFFSGRSEEPLPGVSALHLVR